MENRDYKNYGGGIYRHEDFFGELVEAFIVPTEISLGDMFYIRFRGWEGKGDELATDKFAVHTIQNSTWYPNWFRNFPENNEVTFEQVKASNPELFTAINSAVFDFLNLENSESYYSRSNFELKSISINSLDFKISVSVKRTDGLLISKSIDTAEEFETVKQQFPELVGLLIMFAWSFAKARDKKLAKCEMIMPE